jgi:hypothetical protein
VTTRETQGLQGATRRADPAGNERLTAMAGAVLLVLFVAECLTLHHLSFFLWALFMVIHLASYVPQLPRKLSGRADQARHLLAARPTRWLLLCGSLAAGLGLAFATYHLSGKFGGSSSILP